MIFILALVGFPLGYLIKKRSIAYLVFGLAYAHLYTYQTAELVLEAVHGSKAAFGDVNGPDWNWFDDTIGYLVFTTLVYAAGLALIAAGHAVARRRAPREQPVGAA